MSVPKNKAYLLLINLTENSVITLFLEIITLFLEIKNASGNFRGLVPTWELSFENMLTMKPALRASL